MKYKYRWMIMNLAVVYEINNFSPILSTSDSREVLIRLISLNCNSSTYKCNCE